MHHELETVFNKLETTRNLYFGSAPFNGDIHSRVVTDKWSIAESIYHCYKLLKITRLTLQIYLPLAKPIVNLRKSVQHNRTMPNIYEGKTMPAPIVLFPGDVSHLSKGDLRNMLEEETEQIKSMIKKLSDKEIFGIRLPDPVPNFPNILQTIKLAEIHERHHYKIVSERQQARK